MPRGRQENESQGPAGRFYFLPIWSTCAMKYSRPQKLAKDFLRLAARSISSTQITVWTGDPDLDGWPVQPHPRVKPL